MILPILILLAADITDLGVINQQHAVILETESSRRDFSHFKVELKPDHATNCCVVTLTNGLLTAEHLVGLLSGRGVMGVQTVHSNGEISEVSLYTYDLRRSSPPKPSARLIQVLTPPEAQNGLTNELRKIRERRVVPDAPSPQTFRGKVLSYGVSDPKPLPGGTNRTYPEHLDHLADHAMKRRNE